MRRLVILLIAILLLFVSVSGSSAQNLSVTISIADIENDPDNASVYINVYGYANINSLSIESSNLYCLDGVVLPITYTNVVLPFQMTLPWGQYRLTINHGRLQTDVRTFFVGDYTKCQPQVVENPIQTVQLSTVSDWILQTYSGLGVCPGHYSDISVGDLVKPTYRYTGSTGVLLRPLPTEDPVNGVRSLGKLSYSNEYAVAVGGPVCFRGETYRQVALLDYYGYFNYGWMTEVNEFGTRVIEKNELELEAPAHFLASLLDNPPLVDVVVFPAGRPIMFEDTRFAEPRGVAVRTMPGYSDCIPGVEVITRVNLSDQVFRILNRNLTGDWLLVELADGTIGWIATRLTVTNLSNPSLYALLPAMQEFSSCPTITP